ncbi:hypothetical protein SAMN06264364_107153 [Quadrisphaera granulorum]|uniref:Uncharacterized protein n=1 Tax=Quadrisphaera granulorum TaxID=317664 RepID=A0A316AWD4_9ACTN|nr:hypothetical protein [Quadrisphaera granulorum]PWJ54457.1 hypothetical protein BXY45_107153 [Quadrisphaera granulorum]SZE96229.1 hypothetical protein SAMN06264364_107153 [Quadrisphaera granulorum]
MDDPRTGALRAARGLALALAVVAIAAAAHLLGGGQLPPPLLLAGVVVAAACVGHALTARRLSAAAALAALGTGQVVLHSAFELLAPGAGGAPGAPSASALAAVGAHAHRGEHAARPDLAGVHLAGAAGGAGSGHDTALMLVAHVAATVLTAAALAGTDRSLWLLRAWLAPLALLIAVRAPLVHAGGEGLRAPAADALLAPPHQPALCSTTSRRGPPRPVLAPA